MKTLWIWLIFAGIGVVPALAQDADDLAAQTGAQIEPLPAPEQYVPPAADIRSFVGGRLVLRPDATVPDGQIHLKNICRWAPQDSAFFDPVGDLTVAQFAKGGLYAKVTIDQVQSTLRDAGVNVALISFDGAVSCAVNRPDADTDNPLPENWLNSVHAEPAAAVQSPGHSTAPPPLPLPADTTPASLRSLRAILTSDLAARLNMDPSLLQITFNPSDDKELNLVEPYFTFEITPIQTRNLGDVSWSIQILYNGQKHEADISATARAWRMQAELVTPLACRQQIRDSDVVEQRSLIEELPDEPLLTKAQAVGQAASRDLKPGTILTASMVSPVLLAQPGQLVTVTVVQRSFKITTVARSMENGSYGQIIRVRGDTDPTLQYAVTLTGPQEGTVVPGSETENSSPPGNLN